MALIPINTSRLAPHSMVFAAVATHRAHGDIRGAKLRVGVVDTPAGTTLFLCGDVMIGRGIDQILPHSVPPRLFEPYVRSALGYVELAERAHGPVRRPAGFEYVWGDALAELARRQPAARIVNLETAITTCEDAWPGKGIHYRTHPGNVECLASARIDCCSLANNHVLDWGRAGLAETLATLRSAGIRVTGAGADLRRAMAPATIDVAQEQRVLVFAGATRDSGVPQEWGAGDETPGIHLLPDLSPRTVAGVASQVREHARTGDLVVWSIHWGANWGYDIGRAQQRFARGLIDEAGVDVVHGHSSHHVKAIEVHEGRLILYGCGDFLNDYEGIGGNESYHAERSLMYFPTLDAAGSLQALCMVPALTRRLRINRSGPEDAVWLAEMLSREGRALGTRAVLRPDASLELEWS